MYPVVACLFSRLAIGHASLFRDANTAAVPTGQRRQEDPAPTYPCCPTWTVCCISASCVQPKPAPVSLFSIIITTPNPGAAASNLWYIHRRFCDSRKVLYRVRDCLLVCVAAPETIRTLGPFRGRVLPSPAARRASSPRTALTGPTQRGACSAAVSLPWWTRSRDRHSRRDRGLRGLLREASAPALWPVYVLAQ